MHHETEKQYADILSRLTVDPYPRPRLDIRRGGANGTGTITVYLKSYFLPHDDSRVSGFYLPQINTYRSYRDAWDFKRPMFGRLRDSFPV